MDSHSIDPAAAHEARGWLHTTRFLTTAPEMRHLPQAATPEIAFVGRSNVGKSSAINALTQQTQLAFASRRPGRTRDINVFAVGRLGQTDTLLADLPGYGYAAVSQADKDRWQGMLTRYLVQRPNLAGVVLLCDARHGLRPLDQALLDAIRPRLHAGLGVLILLTKSDKLTRAEQARALADARAAAPDAAVLLFSAPKRAGLDDASLWLRRQTSAKAIGLSAAPLHQGNHAMIETWMADLRNGTRLSCRSAGARGRPLMLFLHGFPEGAFVWDHLMAHFAAPEHGSFRCVAPNLRGFEHSSAPAAVAAYRPDLLIEDVMQLAAREGEGGVIHTLVAHDWGGAFAWGAAHAHPNRIRRLVIINSPHPATFARDLRSDPAQQKASAYMHFLCHADAEERLAANDYELMWRFMQGSDAAMSWLTSSVKDEYRKLWDCGLTGGCNLYRVTPLKPPLAGKTTAADIPVLAPERVRVDVRTLVLWGMDDAALRPRLLEGLAAYVPDLTIERRAHATHWIVHEQPDWVASQIERFNAR